jgi:DNA-binding Lrp family transcriptional regulator
MDELDEKLLSQLAQNARVSVATLSRRLKVARSTVQARIERLETSGIIDGYTLRFGDAATRNRIRATVLLRIEPRAGASVVESLEALDSVEIAHTTAGRYDLSLRVAAGSTGALDDALAEITALPGVVEADSLIHLSTRINRRH